MKGGSFKEMKAHPIHDLNKCSVKGCDNQSDVIVQRKIGDERMVFGYCLFHSVISATFFPNRTNRIEITLGAQ